MNQNTVSNLPIAAATSIGNAAKFAATSAWSHYMKAPMAASGLIVFAVGSMFVSTNALFGQAQVHPSPFFFDATNSQVVAPSSQQPAPVLPAAMPDPVQITREIVPIVSQPAPLQPINVDSGTIDAQSAVEVTNEKLARAQSILKSMGMFTGEVDGYYGPQTAQAIRAFELRAGLTPKGALDNSVIERILRSSSVDAARPQAALDAPVIDTSGTGQAALQSLVGETQPTEQIVAQTTPPTATLTQQDVVPPQAQVDSPAVQSGLTSIEPSAVVASAAPQSTPAFEPVNVTSKAYIEAVQRGLASLAFLQGGVDGVAGESTAKAIRNFEVFYNYEVTGAITPELLDMLVNAGASVN